MNGRTMAKPRGRRYKQLVLRPEYIKVRELMINVCSNANQNPSCFTGLSNRNHSGGFRGARPSLYAQNLTFLNVKLCPKSVNLKISHRRPTPFFCLNPEFATENRLYLILKKYYRYIYS